MIGQQEFEGAFSRFLNHRRIGVDDHPFGHRERGQPT